MQDGPSKPLVITIGRVNKYKSGNPADWRWSSVVEKLLGHRFKSAETYLTQIRLIWSVGRVQKFRTNNTEKIELFVFRFSF